MAGALLLLDDYLGRHETATGHPECSDRLIAIAQALEPLRENLTVVKSRRAEFAEIALCHHPHYVESVLTAIAQGATELAGGDVSVSTESGEVALRAAGGVISVVGEVVAGRASHAFCAVRPPGHHARPAAAMGFCLFNNVAIAARHAQKFGGLERIAIVDWDVHHGNGTQEMFYADGSVLFFSTHQSPWYPGTGHLSEAGEGAGRGLTINHPLPAGAGRTGVLGAFHDRLLPSLEKFRPELILISAGFDSRKGDPLGGLVLTDEDFVEMTRLLCEAAAKYCEGRLVSVLEGGYDLMGLGLAARAHVAELMR